MHVLLQLLCPVLFMYVLQFPSNKTMTINLVLSPKLHNNVKKKFTILCFFGCTAKETTTTIIMQNFLVSAFDINMIYRNHVENENALTAVLSLASLEITKCRSRNEEAINSTRNWIYLLKVFHFPLLNIYFLFVSKLI